MIKIRLTLGFAILFSTAFSQNIAIPHLAKQGTATQLVVQGKPLLMLAGELHNSSTSNADYMRPIWRDLKDRNLNTVVAAASWELVEKEKGKFDFSLVDSMIFGARNQGLHLIIIWFGSWKNGGSTYMPSWVKKDVQQYPRVKDADGKSLEILSAFSDATCQADANAFRMLMKHIKEVDQQYQTVVMMQVENEVGVLKTKRDFNEYANKAFSSKIPLNLATYLTTRKNDLTPELSNVWRQHGSKTNGTWEEVFGKGFYNDTADWKTLFYYTEELFMAYQYASYIGRVAAAGKQEYAIPMFVNAWQKSKDYSYPGKYPGGGPLPQVMDAWRAGAPSIDMIVPDIYVPEFASISSSYHRLGNPLLIPETRGGAAGAARAFYAFGQHDAMCFSPFGIDGDYRVDEDLKQSYATLQQLQDLILANQGKGNMAGVLADTTDPVQHVTLGGYSLEVRLQSWPTKATIAGGIIVNTAPNEFIVAGKGFDVFFTPTDKSDLPLTAIDYADEGTYKNGKWIPGRRLNGDETHTASFDGTGLRFTNNYSIQHVKLYRYK